MPLCARCSDSALLQTRWERLQPREDEPKVVHSWLKAESSPECVLCRFVEDEIRAVGRFEEEILTLIRFIRLYLELVPLKDHAPSVGDIDSSSLGQDVPSSEHASVRHDGVDPRPSAAPVASPRASSSGQNRPRCAAGDDIDGTDSPARHDGQGPETNQYAPAGPSGGRSLWERARDLIASKRASTATVDQESLEQAMDSMEQVFRRHDGSQNCIVCSSMEGLPASGELQAGRLGHSFQAATQSERESAIKNHLPPPDPRAGPSLRRPSIVKVDFVLEKRGRWSAIRLQEFRRDEKYARVGASRRLLDLPDPSRGRHQPVAEEPGEQSGSPPAPPALADVLETGPEAAPEAALRKEYRQHAKDVCVLVPFREGKRRFGRKVAERVDFELIRLWLSRCGKKHSLCSRRNKESYPPGLILIDADKMCLAPVAPGSPVRYIALSYVWGCVAQPTLTRAVLETWASEGQLRAVETPRTIRDAIRLAQAIGYRYVWVDALCIVQDDEAARHAQISQMHEVYRHADMTVVAAGGDNCSEGLPGVTPSRDRAYKHRRCELPGLCLMKVPSSTRHGVETSPWRTRGWTFQEELCSRRTLVLLPDVMFFSCASAVWREDVQLEAEDTLPRSDEGLASLTSMLHQKGPGDGKDLLVLFRDLVKQYMQRTLSRTDDMENAFAGVAGILEPLIGPAHHGIPEHMFAEVIQGCWFWDTSLQRRAGFPSWSWTGWIYRREQADVGIQPLSTASDTSNPLAFYKVGDSGAELLGQPGLARCSAGEFLPRVDAELRSHFVPDEDDIRSKHEALQHREGLSGGLIAFYTSVAHLRLRTPPGGFVGSSREYRVFDPQTNRQLTSIRLNAAYVAERGTLLPFMVADHDPDRRAFRLMLISMDGGTAERVNVTAQGRLVREDDWKGASPRRELIFMS